MLHREWRDFGHNRTELLKLAKGRADYLLLIDADMTVTYDRTSLLDLAADSYLLRHDEPVEYWIKRLVRGDRDWRYEGRTHEHILTEPPDVATKSDAIVIHHHADGGSRSDKFERDLRLLAADLRDDPANARSVFYLAQTYRDLGRTDDAIAQYERRAEMGGWDEEVFYSTFQAGVLRAERGNWPVGMAVLIAAWELRPSRLEPVYELASRLASGGSTRAHTSSRSRGVDRPPPNDILFVSRWVYRWGLLFEYSITSYWVGEVQAALNACSSAPDVFRPARELPQSDRDEHAVLPRTDGGTSSAEEAGCAREAAAVIGLRLPRSGSADDRVGLASAGPKGGGVTGSCGDLGSGGCCLSCRQCSR